jgi:hypothetical protein
MEAQEGIPMKRKTTTKKNSGASRVIHSDGHVRTKTAFLSMRRRNHHQAGCRAYRRRLLALGIGLSSRCDAHRHASARSRVFRSQRFSARGKKKIVNDNARRFYAL